ncbi:MAG TPA: hypothetical protein VK112_04780 [Fodinibius sp.]|nr:hypothetical protein [Fodinibius sp.]
MRNENNDCIRYLMKEMDPSEELLMERAMMEDEDLLIEVESMRQTLSKLDRLPQKSPSSEVTDSVLEQAAKQAELNRSAQKSTGSVYRYAVAATLALTLTAGGAWLFMGSSTDRSSQQLRADQEVGSQPVFDIAEIASFAKVPATEKKEVDPWVDRNDVLEFGASTLKNSDQFNALRQRSTRKLQLIDSPTIQRERVKSIQLTGTGN